MPSLGLSSSGPLLCFALTVCLWFRHLLLLGLSAPFSAGNVKLTLEVLVLSSLLYSPSLHGAFFFHSPIFSSCKYCGHPALHPKRAQLTSWNLLLPLRSGPSLGSRGAQFSLNPSEQTLAVLRAGSDHDKGKCHHSITEVKSNWEKWVDSFT